MDLVTVAVDGKLFREWSLWADLGLCCGGTFWCSSKWWTSQWMGAGSKFRTK